MLMSSLLKRLLLIIIRFHDPTVMFFTLQGCKLADLNKPCEICGDIGFDDVIRICSQCKATHEHVYCMRSVHEDDPEKWVCDECQSPTQIPLPSPVLSKPIEGFKIGCTVKRLPMKSKVQFLPPEEAMVLESGAPKNKFSPSKPSKIDHTTFRKRLPPSFSVKPNPRAVPPAIRKPLKPGSMPRSSSDETWLGAAQKKPVTNKHAWKESAVHMGWSSRSAITYNGAEEKVTGEGSGRHVCQGTAKPRPSGEQLNSSTERKNNVARRSSLDLRAASSGEGPAKNVFQRTTAKPLPSKEISKMNTEKENPYSKQLDQDLKAASSERGPQCQSSDVLTPLPFSELQELIMEKCGDDECATTKKKSTDESMEFSKVAMKFEKFLPNHPAESPTWRGNFNVTSNSFYGLYDGIVAHPPSKVHRKVYELSKQLPELLQFELLPRLSLWVELFDEDIPGAIDIGLYFLPLKSCEGMYFCLVERLNECDMLLKSCINGVELLIFSSKNLEVGCKKIDQRCFLWGVFRSREDSVMGDKETSAGIEAPIDDQACGMEDDMEVDMIGGQEMDNVDKVVAKPAQLVLDATPEFSPVKIKEEVQSPGNVARDLSSLIELCFERELQKSFDRFDTYVKGKGIQAVKKEKY